MFANSSLQVLFLYLWVSQMASISQAAQCGPPVPTLLGRGTSNLSNVPWSSTITRRHELFPEITFTGVLISPTIILTSAHNFLAFGTYRLHILPSNSYFVTLGTRHFGDPLLVGELAKTVNMTHIRIHVDYKIGNWMDAVDDYALVHLSEDITDGTKIQPVCLPESDDNILIHQLHRPSPNLTDEECVLTGWNLGAIDNISLRLKIQEKQNCLILWNDSKETRFKEYGHRWCAFVGNNNDHNMCIHRDVASVRLMNGSYYINGLVNNFFSTPPNRLCLAGAVYHFQSIESNTFDWIENNIRCGSTNFTCSNGQCVKLSAICDKNADCEDRSDEEPLYCRGLNFCNEQQYACGVYGKCIEKEKVADGIVDCENGEDEEKPPLPLNTPLPIHFLLAIVASFVLIGCVIIYLWRVHYNMSSLNKKMRDITLNEVDNFLMGSISDSEMNISLSGNTIYKEIQALPWNTELNIPSYMIRIGQEINRGAFGIVYKANLWNPTQTNYTNVAVKTHLGSVGVDDFKALLRELKILAYVGEHENVVKLIGACIDNIRQRDVLIVVEYCPNGNLLHFLRNNRFIDLNQRQSSNNRLLLEYHCEDPHQFGNLDTNNLVQWSKQIASGMLFLAKKMIVHGDLAARNVLLTSKLDAKIIDFGLSRQLDSSGIYTKSSKDPLPWKWMAPETLQLYTFSEKADIWSYGITMWEIFSQGDIPYGRREWDEGFLIDLLGGMTLRRPEFASDKIFSIMYCCWLQLPNDRPTFVDLLNQLEELQNTKVISK